MGILNVTPDSFYSASRTAMPDDAILRGRLFHQQGADLLDIGGESSRPGAQEVFEDEELERVLPVVEVLARDLPIPISIDTRKPRVAEACVRAGASLINDITGFTQPLMREMAASLQVDICVMHMQGNPEIMQLEPTYPEGVIETLLRWFDQQVNLLIRAGVKQRSIILDPGIGFGKTVAHNVEILENLPRLKTMGFPLLLGVSRKSFMRKILSRPTEALLPATLAVNARAIQHGVEIIRVHDVAEHRDVIDLMYAMEQGVKS